MSDLPPAPSVTTPRRHMPLLGEHTAGRDNNVLPIRYLAAAAVILFHCYALTDRWNDEPLHSAFPPMNLGALGVYVFFVLSGFLVTQSWLMRPAVMPTQLHAYCASIRH
jgi:peptidoglycan/LPS O-acetylase OafA/YrhL